MYDINMNSAVEIAHCRFKRRMFKIGDGHLAPFSTRPGSSSASDASRSVIVGPSGVARGRRPGHPALLVGRGCHQAIPVLLVVRCRWTRQGSSTAPGGPGGPGGPGAGGDVKGLGGTQGCPS